MGRASSEQNRQYEGMSVAEIAAKRGDLDPADTFIALMAEGRRQHPRSVPQPVRGERPDGDAVAVGGARK